VTQRILSISGLRGVVGDGLDPEFILRFASAFGTLLDGGTVIVSRDGRATGDMLRRAVLAGLTATGCQVLDAGIATTPTCGVLVDHFQASGGLQITASHNPVEWNGLKPFSADGSVFDAEMGRRLLAVLDSGDFSYRKWDRVGDVQLLEASAVPHLERVCDLVDVSLIRERQFRVVLDCNHGSGAVAGPQLLERLGCQFELLGGVADGKFAHTPEPIKANLSSLCAAVRDVGADVGFAQDPDADRLAIVDNTGRYIGEELTLALAADVVLASDSGPVVVNGSTSRVTADIAQHHGCAFYRSFVGEAHVCAQMRKVQARLGGEGNGGVIEPKVGYVRDSLVAMAYVLQGLAAGNRSLSAWVDVLPEYHIVKDKLHCPGDRVPLACDALQAHYPDATPALGDGLRLDWDDCWVQVRASNTEPVIRVIAEAPHQTDADALCADAVDVVRAAVA